MQYVTIIKRYEVLGRNFTIVKDGDGFYLAIEDKYIDNEGRTTEKLNGCQLCASRDLNMCLQTISDRVHIDDLLSHGATKAEAFSIVAGVPIEIAEQLF